MLAVYLAKLPEHGGAGRRTRRPSPSSPRRSTSAELVLSPIFGVLSDRLGHHRMMLVGPSFGAVAVDPDRADDEPRRSSAGRGSSRARRPPPACPRSSATSRSRPPAARSSAARRPPASRARRWPASGAGFAVAPLLFAALGPTAFFVNAARLRRLVPDLPLRRRGPRRGERAAAHAAAATARRPDRPGRATRSCSATSHVWLLAPTWIAVNASIGLWFSQSIFQFSRANPRFPDQALMRGFQPDPDLARRGRHRRSSSGPACCTGATGSSATGGRRSSSYGIAGGGGRSSPAASSSTTPTGRADRRCRSRPAVAARGGLFVLAGRDAGRRRAARRHVARRSRPTAARSWASTACSSPSARSAAACSAASRRTGTASTACSSGRALLPRDRARARCRGCATRSTASTPSIPSSRRERRPEPRDGPSHERRHARPPARPDAARPRRARRGRRAASPRDRGRASRSCAPAATRSTRRSRRTRSSGVVLPSGCGIGGDAFWLIWDEAAGRQTALNGSGRAPAAADPAALRARRPGDAPATAGRSRSPSRARSARGATRTPGTAGCRAATSWRRRSSWRGTGSRRGTGSSRRSRRRCRRSSRRSARARASSRSTGRTAAPGGPASGSGCRPSRRRSSGWPRSASTTSTTARSASARRRGLAAVGCRDHGRRPARAHLDLDRADRDRLPRRPGHDPPAEPLGHRRPRAAEHPRDVRAAAAGGVRAERRRGRPLGPPRDRGRQARDGRPRPLPDRPGVPRHPGRAARLEGPRGRARRA